MHIRKKRIIYFLLILITIPLGLCSRIYGNLLPNFFAEYAGDVLYAICAFWTFRFVFIKYPLTTITLTTFMFCIFIETLQLYQAPWMQAVRQTPPFGWLLGYGFLWSDWVCYAVGTLFALAFTAIMERFYAV